MRHTWQLVSYYIAIVLVPVYLLDVAASRPCAAASFDRSLTVDAGPDQTIVWPKHTLRIEGHVAAMKTAERSVVHWEEVAGPAPVQFDPDNAASTTVSFNTTGIYLLRLNVTSGTLLLGSDEMIVAAWQPADLGHAIAEAATINQVDQTMPPTSTSVTENTPLIENRPTTASNQLLPAGFQQPLEISPSAGDAAHAPTDAPRVKRHARRARPNAESAPPETPKSSDGDSSTPQATADEQQADPQGDTMITTSPVTIRPPGVLTRPRLRPRSGTFDQPIDVKITSEPDATVYVTLDGSNPTVASPQYTEPIPIGPGTTTIKAIAAQGKRVSDVRSGTYTIRPVKIPDTCVQVSVFESNGRPTADVDVLIESAGMEQHQTTAAGIARFSLLEGTLPKEFLGRPVAISAQSGDMAVRAEPNPIILEGKKSFVLLKLPPLSAVFSALTGTTISTVAAQVATPTIDPAGGTFQNPVAVTLHSPMPEAQIRYTLDGTEPTEESPSFSSELSIKAAGTLRARAFRAGYQPSDVAVASFVITIPPQPKAAQPIIDPPGGSFAGAAIAYLATTTPEVIVRYTLDGTEPTENSPVSPEELSIKTTGTLRARAFRRGYQPSEVTAVSFIITTPKVARPTIDPPGGDFTNLVSVSLRTDTEGAVIRYTLDGTDPTETSPTYAPGLTIRSHIMLRARAFRDGYEPSEAATASFVITTLAAVPPIIDPSGGEFSGTVSVNLRTTMKDAVIRYTLDGTEPKESSLKYTSGLAIRSSTTLRARAFCAGYEPSSIATAGFTLIPPKAAQPTVDPAGGTFAAPVRITVKTVTAKSDIRYTLDGTEPTRQSQLYTSPITISQSTRLNMRAFRSGYEPSDVAGASYAIDASKPAPVATESSGYAVVEPMLSMPIKPLMNPPQLSQISVRSGIEKGQSADQKNTPELAVIREAVLQATMDRIRSKHALSFDRLMRLHRVGLLSVDAFGKVLAGPIAILRPSPSLELKSRAPLHSANLTLYPPTSSSNGSLQRTSPTTSQILSEWPTATTSWSSR